jgi:hypothetical protein
MSNVTSTKIEPLATVVMGHYVSDYVCPTCGGVLKLQGVHLDNKENDMIVQCMRCMLVWKTNAFGNNLMKAENKEGAV